MKTCLLRNQGSADLTYLKDTLLNRIRGLGSYIYSMCFDTDHCRLRLNYHCPRRMRRSSNLVVSALSALSVL